MSDNKISRFEFGFFSWSIIGACLFLAGIMLNNVELNSFDALDTSCAAYESNESKIEYNYKVDSLDRPGFAKVSILTNAEYWELSVDYFKNGYRRKTKCLVGNENLNIIKLWDCRINGLDFVVTDVDISNNSLNIQKNTPSSSLTTSISSSTPNIYSSFFLPFLCLSIDKSKLPISVCVFQPEIRRLIRYKINSEKHDSLDSIVFTSEYSSIRVCYDIEKYEGRRLPTKIEYHYPDIQYCLLLNN